MIALFIDSRRLNGRRKVIREEEEDVVFGSASSRAAHVKKCEEDETNGG
jgi:hypothetical protein